MRYPEYSLSVPATGQNLLVAWHWQHCNSYSRRSRSRQSNVHCRGGKYYGPQNALDSTLAWGDILTLTATEIVSSCLAFKLHINDFPQLASRSLSEQGQQLSINQIQNGNLCAVQR